MRRRIYDENEKSGKINRFISAEPSCTVREKMDRNEVIDKMRLLPRLFGKNRHPPFGKTGA